jgi:hypothetical protein
MSRIGNDLFKFLDNVLEEHKIKLNDFVLEDELYNIRLDDKL